MAEQESPPPKYKLFDGFIKSNLLVKGLYILTFPTLAILVEGLEYRNSQKQQEQYEAGIRERLQNPVTRSEAEQGLNQAVSQASTKFRDMVRESDGRNNTALTADR